MATINTTVTSAWTKVADDTDTTVLIQCAADGVIWEVATIDTETEPTVTRGHVVRGHDQTLTRSVIGDGFMYVRTMNTPQAEFVVSLTA